MLKVLYFSTDACNLICLIIQGSSVRGHFFVQAFGPTATKDVGPVPPVGVYVTLVCAFLNLIVNVMVKIKICYFMR